MVITAIDAIKLLPYVFSLVGKVLAALSSPEPVSIEEELKMLDLMRLRPKEEIIEENK